MKLLDKLLNKKSLLDNSSMTNEKDIEQQLEKQVKVLFVCMGSKQESL